MSLGVKILIWFGIVVGAILAVPIALLGSGAFKMFYIPSESMNPTLEVGDKLVARMGGAPAELHRGDIVLVDAGNRRIYVQRVAGLPGDRIALRGGLVVLDGRPVAQRFVATDPAPPGPYGASMRRLSEQFPGEDSPHEIYDSGPSTGDDFDEQRVLPGHLFLLGDNRDHSADSRFSQDDLGLEQVPLERVRGVPLFYYWTVGRNRIGDDAGH
jgi:signal peptidase I